MKKFTYVVSNPRGVHARPCALLAQCCTNFKSMVTVSTDEKTASARNVLELMALGAVKGDVLTFQIEGEDEEKTLEAIQEVLNKSFNEKKNSGILKVAFFGTKDYDRIFFSELEKDKGEGAYNVEIKYFSSNLGPETANLAKGYDAVCIFVNDDASRPVVEQLHDNGIRLILLRCAGFNNVDLDAATAHGVCVMNTPGQNSNAVAELAFGLMVMAVRNFYNGTSGSELKGKKLGIHAFGNVGRNVARIAKGFGMEIYAYDAFCPKEVIEEAGVIAVDSAEKLYETCNVISLHIPATAETKNSIGDALVGKMPKGGLLVNTARKEVINESELIHLMEERPDLKYVTDIMPVAHEEFAAKFAGRYFSTPKKMGAQTAEANINAGIAAAKQIEGFLKEGCERFRVNK